MSIFVFMFLLLSKHHCLLVQEKFCACLCAGYVVVCFEAGCYVRKTQVDLRNSLDAALCLHEKKTTTIATTKG